MAASAASIVTGEQHRLSELDKILDSKARRSGRLPRERTWGVANCSVLFLGGRLEPTNKDTVVVFTCSLSCNVVPDPSPPPSAKTIEVGEGGGGGEDLLCHSPL